MPPLFSLSGRHVDVWYTYVAEAADPRLLEQYGSLLSPDEAQREQRFLFERVRHQFRVTRALVRWVLSQYHDVEPADWVFQQDAYGKPAVVGPSPYRPAFNLSHTNGLVACAVTSAECVGVDVEFLDRQTAGVDLARRYFAPDEVALLERAPPDERQRAFFQIWTLKESYIKAVGQGLSIPLDSFWFALPSDDQPRISFDPRRDDDPARWQFAQASLASRHQLAVGLPLDMAQDLVVHCRKVVPFQSSETSSSVVDRAAGWFAEIQ